jgi:hypothetical protein
MNKRNGMTCALLAGRLRREILTANITHAAKRIYGIAEFMYYAVAEASDGSSRGTGGGGTARRRTDAIQTLSDWFSKPAEILGKVHDHDSLTDRARRSRATSRGPG